MHALSFDFHNTLYQVVTFTVFNLSWVRVRLVVQLINSVWLLATQWTAACPQASLSFTSSPNLLKLMSTESVMPSDHLILCGRLLLLPSIFPSIRVFSDESVLYIRWPNSTSGGVSSSVSVLPMTIQAWFPLGLTGLIFLLSKVFSRVFSSTTVSIQKHQFFMLRLLYDPPLTSIHDHWKDHKTFDSIDLCWQRDVSAFYRKYTVSN